MEETKKCPYCGETILAAAKKCKYCGEWLYEADKEPTEKEMIACPVCGEEIEEGTKECPYCHEPVTQEKQTKETEIPNTVPPVESPMTNEIPEDTKPDSQKLGFFEYYFEEAWSNKTNGEFNIIPGFNFSGRMPRKQFWISTLMFSIVFGSLSGVFMSMMPYYNWTKIFLIIFMILWTIKSIEMQIRRLHDVNKSGWLIILSFIPVANIYPLILFCMKGSDSKKTQWNKKDSVNLIFMAIFIVCIIITSNLMSGLNNDNSSNDESSLESVEQGKEKPNCFIENLARFTLYTTEGDINNEGAVFHYDCGRKLDVLLFFNQSRMDARLVDENKRKTVLNLDFENIGLDMSEPEGHFPYTDNEYLIGQYDFDGDKVDELLIAVKSNHDEAGGDLGGICLNIWRLDDMQQWILPASDILGEPACELILNKIKIPRNLRDFYYEWTFQNGTFEYTGNY